MLNLPQLDIAAVRIVFKELSDDIYNEIIRKMKEEVSPMIVWDQKGNILFVIYPEGVYPSMVKFLRKYKEKYNIMKAHDADVYVYGFRCSKRRII